MSPGKSSIGLAAHLAPKHKVWLTWDGGSLELGPSEHHDFGDSISNLDVTLLTAGASYDLKTNGDIATVLAS